METYELSEKEFKIIMLRKSSEIQENTDNSVNSEKQCMNKIRGSTEKSHTHTHKFDFKNTMHKIKNTTESFNSRLNQIEGKITKLKIAL